MLVIHASMPLDPETRDEALDHIEGLAETVRAEEEGTLEYRAATDAEDPNVVRFFERYKDEAALGAHSRPTTTRSSPGCCPSGSPASPRWSGSTSTRCPNWSCEVSRTTPAVAVDDP